MRKPEKSSGNNHPNFSLPIRGMGRVGGRGKLHPRNGKNYMIHRKHKVKQEKMGKYQRKKIFLNMEKIE